MNQSASSTFGQEPLIRVLLVDDDPLCLEGLRQLVNLADDLTVVGEASDAEEACKLGQSLRPDVIVIDAELPRSSCVRTMMELAGGPRPHLHPSFICLAVYPDQHDAALQAGATSFLRKDGSAQELLDAIRDAARARQEVSA